LNLSQSAVSSAIFLLERKEIAGRGNGCAFALKAARYFKSTVRQLAVWKALLLLFERPLA
jgi:hypothetical protein